jgi:hypothetical protein
LAGSWFQARNSHDCVLELRAAYDHFRGILESSTVDLVEYPASPIGRIAVDSCSLGDVTGIQDHSVEPLDFFGREVNVAWLRSLHLVFL